MTSRHHCFAQMLDVRRECTPSCTSLAPIGPSPLPMKVTASRANGLADQLINVSPAPNAFRALDCGQPVRPGSRARWPQNPIELPARIAHQVEAGLVARPGAPDFRSGRTLRFTGG